MNTLEKLSLKWNNFQENVISLFSSLREDIDLTDITLACKDGLQVQVQKVVFFSIKWILL